MFLVSLKSSKKLLKIQIKAIKNYLMVRLKFSDYDTQSETLNVFFCKNQARWENSEACMLKTQ